MNRISELDALRGFAALAVVAFHYTTRFGQIYGHPSPPPALASYGAHGVDLFFMISGFVIFMTLERVSSAADFVVSRVTRLFPAYWAAVLATFAVTSHFGLPGREVGVRTMLINLTMVHELFHVPDVDSVYWTLQVEMMFYAAMLALYWLGWLPRIGSALSVWLTLSVLASAAQQTGPHLPGLTLVATLLNLPYIPLFGLGILFYRVYTVQGYSAGNVAMLFACLATVAYEGSTEALLAALLGCVLFAALLQRRLRFITLRVSVFLGTISYSLYLLHQNIGYVTLRTLYRAGLVPTAAIVITLAVAILAATALTFTVERPALRLIRRWYLERREQPAPTDADVSPNAPPRITHPY